MSEWYDNQKKPESNLRKLLQERIEKENPSRELTAEETNRLRKLEGIADKTKTWRKRAKPSVANVVKRRRIRTA